MSVSMATQLYAAYRSFASATLELKTKNKMGIFYRVRE